MPLTILRPTAVGAYDGMVLAAGGSKVAAVDPGSGLSHDDDTTYLQSDVASAASQGVIVTLVTGVASVLSFTQHMRAGVGNITTPGESSGSVSAKTRMSGVDSSAVTIASNLTDLATYSNYSVAAPRPGGGSWSNIDFEGNSIELVYVNTGNGSADPENSDPNNKYTSFWGELDYRPHVGGFAFLVASLGPLVAVGLHEMPKVAAEVWARTRTLIKPDEYLAAWRDLREWRRPVVFA